jgi:hypothetical protein
MHENMCEKDMHQLLLQGRRGARSEQNHACKIVGYRKKVPEIPVVHEEEGVGGGGLAP